jgi:hypothetical protein
MLRANGQGEWSGLPGALTGGFTFQERSADGLGIRVTACLIGLNRRWMLTCSSTKKPPPEGSGLIWIGAGD